MDNRYNLVLTKTLGCDLKPLMSMFYSQYVGGQVCCPTSATNTAMINTYRQLHSLEMRFRVNEEKCANKILQDQITEIQVILGLRTSVAAAFRN